MKFGGSGRSRYTPGQDQTHQPQMGGGGILTKSITTAELVIRLETLQSFLSVLLLLKILQGLLNRHSGNSTSGTGLYLSRYSLGSHCVIWRSPLVSHVFLHRLNPPRKHRYERLTQYSVSRSCVYAPTTLTEGQNQTAPE